MSPYLRIHHPQSNVLQVTLCKPQRLNALDGEMLATLSEQLQMIEAHKETRVVILTGEGRAFCTGSDLKWLQEGVLHDPSAHMRYQDQMQACFSALECSSAVVIAAVNGLALAGGLELALAADIIITADEAELGDEHITKNFLPSGGGSQRLPRKVGLARGLYHLLTGARISGARAVEIGLAAQSVPALDVLAHSQALAAELATRDGLALASMKQLVRRGGEMTLDDALSYERWMQYRYRMQSSAMLAGVKAFSQK